MAKIEVNDVSAALRDALDAKGRVGMADEMPFRVARATLPVSYLSRVVADPAAAARAAGVDLAPGARVEARVKQRQPSTSEGQKGLAQLTDEIVIIIIIWDDGSIDIIILLP